MPKPEIDPRLPIDCKLCIKTPKERLLCDTLISVREELVLVLPCVQVERVKERVIKSQSERQLPARKSSDNSSHSGARNGSTPGVHIFSKEE